MPPRVKPKPVCMVPTCRRKQEIFPNETFYTLPHKGDFRDSWLKVINADGLIGSEIAPKSKHYKVCSIHFASSDFERDLKSELLGISKPKKNLKHGVIPSLFLPPSKDENETLQQTNHDDDEGNVDEPDKIEPQPKEESADEPKRVKRSSRRITTTSRKTALKRNKAPRTGCLVCAKSSVEKHYTNKFNHPGANNNDLLNRQLWQVFVLQNVFKFSSSKCQQLLEKFGTAYNPESWFHLCSKCASDIALAMGFHEEIMRLQLKISKIFEKICEQAKTTVEMEKHAVLAKNEVEIELWNSIREMNSNSTEVISKAADEIKAEPVEPEPMEDNDFLHASCSSPFINQTEEGSNNNENDLASRIDRILQQNAAIVGQPISRPDGLESDSGSDDDDDLTTHHRMRYKRSLAQREVARRVRLGKVQQSEEEINPLKASTAKKFNLLFKRVVIKKARQYHPKFSRLKCSSCPAVFCSEEFFSKHNEDHQISQENGRKFDCQFCGWVVPNESLRAQHLRIRHKDKKQGDALLLKKEMSEDADQNMEEIETTKGATSSSKGQPEYFKFVKCPFCIARYTNLLNFENHLKLHERNTDFQSELNCSYPNCGFTFENKYRLKQHLWKSHKENWMNKCDTCGFTVSKSLKGKWQAHLLKHKLENFKITESGQFECSMCEEHFESKLSLIRHMKASHAGELGIERFLCTDCPRTFVSKRGVEDHARLFHGGTEGTFGQCELCGQGFPTKHSLEAHMKNHNKKHICDKCGGEFNTLANLREHKKRLYGEIMKPTRKRKSILNQQTVTHPPKPWRCFNSRKPQRCKHCQIMLPHLAALRRHVKVHATIQCDICGNRFMTKDNLYKHKRLVHQSGSNTRANCEYCGKEFKHRIAVYGHYTYCRSFRRLEGSKAAAAADDNPGESTRLHCSNCKRSFRSKMALNGHIPFCRHSQAFDEDAVQDNSSKDQE